MYYPRVIIIGETFRLKGGGGITLSNLFKDWPPENIGVITDLISLTNPATNYFYYQLGQEEIKFPFPFFFFQTYFKSGPFIFESGNNPDNSLEVNHKWLSKLKKKIRPSFDNFLNRMGLFSIFYNIKLSESLKKWILEFNPDIIYLQPFYHHMMHFGNLLYKELEIPYAIHIMDDSVKYINRSLFLRSFIQQRIDKDFQKLVNNAKVRMCISEEMAYEYHLRYNKAFSHFRNPIEINQWLPLQKKNNLISSESLKIIYTGRTYSPYFESLIETCNVVDGLNRKNRNVSLEISSIDKNPSFMKKIKNLKGISFYKSVNISEIPHLISRYDIFLIIEDFTKDAQKYLHFSISTRASEGMISGLPVLIYAPDESALCKYFRHTDSGCIVGERDTVKLEMAIMMLWDDPNLRQRITKNAIRTAIADSDSTVVREEFREALTIIPENDKNT